MADQRLFQVYQAAKTVSIILDKSCLIREQFSWLSFCSFSDFSDSTWHTNTTNIKRSNDVIKRIADQFKDMTGVVPIINALNE